MIKQKKGLGRGLNAIFTSSETVAESISHATSNEMAQVAIVNIKPNPTQPRREFLDESLSELADSIRELGVIQPITLMRDGENYTIISGERRWRAAQLAGQRTIPAYIREVDQTKLHVMALVENLQREDLNPMDVAFGMQRLTEEYGLSQDSMAQLIGFKRPTVANYLRLVKLSDRVQASLKAEHISMGHAKALLSVEDTQVQNILLDKIIELSLNVRQAEELARAMQRGEQLETPRQEPSTELLSGDYPECYARLCERLEGLFSENISIKRGKSGGGRIIIEFKDDNDIEAFVGRLGEV